MADIPDLGNVPVYTPPEPNMQIRFGDDPGLVIPIRVSYTLTTRLKWWLFSKVFPVRYEWL